MFLTPPPLSSKGGSADGPCPALGEHRARLPQTRSTTGEPDKQAQKRTFHHASSLFGKLFVWIYEQNCQKMLSAAVLPCEDPRDGRAGTSEGQRHVECIRSREQRKPGHIPDAR